MNILEKVSSLLREMISQAHLKAASCDILCVSESLRPTELQEPLITPAH